MNIEVDKNNIIVSFIVLGSNDQCDIYVSPEKIPSNFFDDFKSNYWIYLDNVIVKNPNFVEDVPVKSQSNDEKLANLAQQLVTSQILQAKTNAQLIQQNAALVKRVNDLQAEKETTNG